MNNKKNIYISTIILVLFIVSMSIYATATKDVKQVNNYTEFKQFVMDTILSLNAKFEVQINNYDKEIYKIEKAINELEITSPEISLVFSKAANGFVSGVNGSKEQTLSYEFSFKSDTSILKNICIIKSPEELHNAFKDSFGNYEKGLYVKIFDYSKEKYDFGEILEEVLSANPGYGTGYKSLNASTYGKGKDVIVEFQYKFDYEYDLLVKMRKDADKKALEIVKTIIKDEMPDYQKELIIHDYIINNTRYDQENYANDTLTSVSRSVFGVLINKIAVCEGYALTMKKLLDLAGVYSIVVVGEAEGTPHAWNIVKIDGDYYQLDPTWDDPYTGSEKQVLRYDYFNITDNTIKKDHTWDTSKYPLCTSTKYNYNKVTEAMKNVVDTTNTATTTVATTTVATTTSATITTKDDIQTKTEENKIYTDTKKDYLKFTIGSKYFEKNKVVREIDYGRDVVPVIIESRTLVPVRVIVESLSGKLGWDEKTRTVTIERDGKKISLIIGNKNAIVDQKNTVLDYPATILNGRTFIPLRFVSENLGCTVKWIQKTKEVEIFT